MIEEIVELLDEKCIHSSQTEYYCSQADETVVIFAPTPDTKKIMVPTALAVEWVQAYQFGLII